MRTRALLLAAALVFAGPVVADEAVAVFAGGCFWCMEPPYDELDGVNSTTSGYTGGHVANPTYQQVVRGDTGHYESVKITYDPDVISYAELLDVFWHNVDPFDAGGQFCDRGSSYRAAVFYLTPAQQAAVRESKARLEETFGRPVVTQILEADIFYPAEDYHQNYYEKNPVRYKFYRWNCGRDARLETIWGGTE